jgi:hypothetical protein
MRKLLAGTILSVLVLGVPVPAHAGTHISIGISLPPPIVFQAPPEVVVIPDTDDVYVAPDIDVELFFWNGWWWRPWGGHWFCSRYYDRGWAFYGYVPIFYYDVDPCWRTYYRDRVWYGHRWNYVRIPHQHLRRNWQDWHRERQWERQGPWGVHSYHPRPPQQRQELRQHRQEQYQQRPEVRRYQQQTQPRGSRQHHGQMQQRPPRQPR